MSLGKDLRVIIVGGGRVGFRAARLLDDRGHHVIMIERDAARCEEITDEYIVSMIEGDATHPDILRQADPAKSDVIAALTADWGTNLAVCMEARQMADPIRTIARTSSEPSAAYEEFVDNIVFPESAGARVAVNAILGSDVRAVVDVIGDLNLIEVRVTEEAPAAGRRLDEMRFPRGSLVVSDFEGTKTARGDTVLQPGQRYIVAAEDAVIDEVMNLLRG